MFAMLLAVCVISAAGVFNLVCAGLLGKRRVNGERGNVGRIQRLLQKIHSQCYSNVARLPLLYY